MDDRRFRQFSFDMYSNNNKMYIYLTFVCFLMESH